MDMETHTIANGMSSQASVVSLGSLGSAGTGVLRSNQFVEDLCRAITWQMVKSGLSAARGLTKSRRNDIQAQMKYLLTDFENWSIGVGLGSVCQISEGSYVFEVILRRLGGLSGIAGSMCVRGRFEADLGGSLLGLTVDGFRVDIVGTLRRRCVLMEYGAKVGSIVSGDSWIEFLESGVGEAQ